MPGRSRTLDDPFTAAIARHVWRTRYRARDGDAFHDHTVDDTWRRVARALGSVERRHRPHWVGRFYDVQRRFRFLPGDRILAGAGTRRAVTLLDCFVMGAIPDSLDGIFAALHEGALTVQQGGGIGYDFSTLRPSGAPAKSSGATAGGPVAFLGLWDAMCDTLLGTDGQSGGMTAALRCDHPDVEAFIAVKRRAGALRRLHLSLLVTDAFVDAVDRDEEWPLVFPLENGVHRAGETVERAWSGRHAPVTCRVWRRVRARELWHALARAAAETGDPRVLFLDRVQREDNLGHQESITATSGSGGVPLPPYGGCVLGSLVLPSFVAEPFTSVAWLDMPALRDTVSTAVRMLDDALDLSEFPLAEQVAQARGSRRVGLGITGLADALWMLGIDYRSANGRRLAADLMREVAHAAYRASIELAVEKGPFPFFARGEHLRAPFVARLPAELRDDIDRNGIRNSHLLAISPAGSLSLLANNVSSGIEPVFRAVHRRLERSPQAQEVAFEVVDRAVQLWREQRGAEPLPVAFVDALEVDAEAQLAMQAALQPFVDQSIEATVALAADAGGDVVEALFRRAHAAGVKGCAVQRPRAGADDGLEPLGAVPAVGSVESG